MKRLLNLLCFLVAVLCTHHAIGQELNHVQGELLVRLRPDVNEQAFAASLKSNRSRLQVDQIDVVASALNIYNLHFDFTSIDENDMMDYISKQPEVDVVQVNHIITPRLTPNDEEFANQWQYINTGQNGGVVGADLDIEKAWDITTGGVTATGDTIVVCVIDDGLNSDHTDFGDNLWVNHNEIPDNNIDDDNNGYVDDIHGWDVWDDDNGIFGVADHGTPVAGIVGAKGNNNIGVAGVNWDVKLMIIRGYGDEAQSLAAYNYPLRMRQLYNATDGALGAFVVATNASWGTDGGKPEDAPLWCAVYDSLGHAGVLNAGATANRNWNIDVEGDLPTACPSDYLMSVTNLNKFDTKVAGAGYGKQTIDLGAYGEETYTVAIPNAYGGFGGTSGATPHVAGAIGLLFSAPCDRLAQLAHDNPAASTQLVRYAILEGVTPNNSLAGRTVTDGRLNINNAMRLLMDQCGTCPRPTAVQVSNIADQSADLSWIIAPDVTESVIEYRAQGSSSWSTLSSTDQQTQLNGLIPCQEYEVRIQGMCQDTISQHSNIVTFSTTGCGVCRDNDYCAAPTGDTDFEYINSFTIDGFQHISGNDGGYGNFIESVVLPTIERGKSYDIEIGAHIDMSPMHYYGMWIDFDGDGVFSVEDEMVVNVEAMDTILLANFDVPSNAELGVTRLRIGLRWRFQITSCGSSEIFGEYEDYCITIDRNSGTNVVSTEDFEFGVYPNPVADQFILKTNDYSISKGYLTIYNQQGKVIRKSLLDISQNDEKVVQVSDFPKGVYIMRFDSEDGQFSHTQKIIKL